MTLQEFINSYREKKIDYDGMYGAQCVDVFRQYCKDVLQIPRTESVVGAKELYTKYESMPLEKKYFERIAYDGRLPKQGDVAVFDASPANTYGHVALVVGANALAMSVFEQDGFRQDGAKLASRGYARCLGFLRRR